MPRLSLSLTLALSTLVLVTGLAPLYGQNEKPKPAAKKAENREALTKEREGAALAFAREHHEELAELLAKLKDSSPRDYQAAIHDLSRASDRIGRLKEKQQRLYDYELQSWKVDSRIRLLQARLSMSGDKQLEDQLRTLLTERAEMRLKRLKSERELVQENLRKIDERLKEAQKARDGVDGELAAMIERANNVQKSNIAKSAEKNGIKAKKGDKPKPEKSPASVRSNDKTKPKTDLQK